MTDLRHPVYGKAAAEAGVRLAATPKPIAALDVPLPTLREQITDLVDRQRVDASVDRLRWLLAEPPLGHTPALQPGDWYEQVFDAMACAHPETCTCTPQEGQS